MRLVDADAFKAEGRELYREAGWDLREVHYSQMDVECNIDMMPTIEAEPVKHGKWIVNNETKEWVTIYCDQCHDGMWNRKDDPFPNYCFNCGARMDGEENNGSDRR